MTVKVEIKLINQENELGNDSFLDLQKRFAKASKKSLRWEKEKPKRDQILFEQRSSLLKAKRRNTKWVCFNS